MAEFLVVFQDTVNGLIDGDELVEAEDFNSAVEIAWNDLRRVFDYPETIPEHVEVTSGSVDITDAMVGTCIANLENSNIRISADQARTMIANSHGLRRALLVYYPNGVCDSMDTADRDYLHMAFTSTFIDMPHWPVNGQIGSEYEQTFVTRLLDIAEKGTVVISPELKDVLEDMRVSAA